MSTAYLVYRPVMDYEESINPYLICLTREQAENVVAKMRSYAQKIANRLPEYTREEEETDIDSLKWTENNERRHAIISKARWPFGIDLSGDLDGFYEVTFNHGCVEIMELPLSK